MNPTGSWYHFQNALSRRLSVLYERRNGDPNFLVGVVFAPDNIPQTRSVLWSSLEYWHFRSGDYFDFFWPGFEWSSVPWGSSRFPQSVTQSFIASLDPAFSDYGRYEDRDLPTIRFSSRVFNDFVDDYHHSSERAFGAQCRHFPAIAHNQPSFRYSGGLDLLLLNTRYDCRTGDCTIDYSSGIFIHLLRLSNLTPGFTVHELFENIRFYAEHEYDWDSFLNLCDQMNIDPYSIELPKTLRISLPSLLGIGASLAEITGFALQFHH